FDQQHVLEDVGEIAGVERMAVIHGMAGSGDAVSTPADAGTTIVRMIGPFANPVLLPRLRRCAGRPLARAGLALLALVLVAGSAFALAMPIAATPPPQAQESPCHGLPSATEQSDRGPQGGCCEVACACAVLHAALVA